MGGGERAAADADEPRADAELAGKVALQQVVHVQIGEDEAERLIHPFRRPFQHVKVEVQAAALHVFGDGGVVDMARLVGVGKAHVFIDPVAVEARVGQVEFGGHGYFRLRLPRRKAGRG